MTPYPRGERSVRHLFNVYFHAENTRWSEEQHSGWNCALDTKAKEEMNDEVDSTLRLFKLDQDSTAIFRVQEYDGFTMRADPRLFCQCSNLLLLDVFDRFLDVVDLE